MDSTMNQSIVRFSSMLIALLSSASFAAVGAWPGDPAAGPQGEATRFSVPIQIDDAVIEHVEQGDEVTIEGFGRLLVPGMPGLPSRVFSVAIPPGSVVKGVTFEPGMGRTLPGTYRVPPVGLPRIIGNEDPQLLARDMRASEENRLAVYGSDEPYPRSVGEYLGRAGYREYQLLDVRISPVQYHPLSGRLIVFSEVTIRVDCIVPAGGSENPAVIDRSPGTEAVAREIVVNYDQARQWYAATEGGPQRGLYDFVIITLQSLTSAVSPLVNWETIKGRTVQVVTTQWIDSHYPGFDLAEKIRNFLREKYPSGAWGIEDVLLVGHYDDVPMRECWQDVGYGRPETDFYYAELSLPDNQSWDADGDRRYGESGQDPIDFYAEVNVGRIPWSDVNTVEQICNKSVAYEQNSDPSYKKNILLLGAYFWSDTDNAVLMEYKVDPSIHPWMADWTATRMYEQNANYWSDYDCDYPLLHGNVMDVWPDEKFAFVNWAGHGSPTSCHIYGLGAPAFITSADCPSLNDTYPAIIFADACSNSDTYYLNIGQAMMAQGAIGFLGATQVAYGMPAWNHPLDGSSQSLDYYFTASVTSGDYTQGQGHQRALRQMYQQGLWYYPEYEAFQWGALWGNPDLGMGINESTVIVDDSGSEFFVLGGSWSVGEHPNANYGSAAYARSPTGERSAGWRVSRLVSSGTYEVYTWKFEHERQHLMATDVPYKVYHRDGESDWIRIDQSTPGNEWIYLGTFSFDGGSSQGVMITDDANGAVIADAIKLERTASP